MNELAVFDVVTATLAKCKVENTTLVFDYADPDGEKDARSHIAKLRKVKTKISNVHKEAKAEALAFGRRLDGKKNELIGEVDSMIAVHKDPLDVIEADNQAIIDAEKKRLERVEERRLLDLEAREAAVKEKEEKAAKEKANAERVEREKRIAEVAAETAKVQAEKKAKDEAAAKEIAEKNRLNAEKCKEQRRIANKNHRKKIEDEIRSVLMEAYIGLDENKAVAVLNALKENRIPHVSINY